MLQRLRKPEPYGRASVIVTVLALVFALVGGAWAASGGLTPKQKREVKKIAKGFQGTGPQGPIGPQGPKGEPGAKGEPGPLLETLPSGKTLTGAWNYFNPEAGGEVVTLSYQFPLAAPISTSSIVMLKPEEGETTDCPGTPEKPQAAKGKLCIYQKELEEGIEVTTGAHFFWPISSTTGVGVFFEGPGGSGSWAVTAP